METIGWILMILTGLAVGWVLFNILTWPRVTVLRHHRKTTGTAGPFNAVGVRHDPVSVLIPARDEEDNLPPLLESLMRQGPEVGEVLVLDDQSTDNTAAVVEEYSKRDPRIRVIRGERRPAGWFGKTWAGKQLADAARFRWFLFLDADVVLERGAVNAVMDGARRHRATFLSCWPRFVVKGFWEKLGVPMLNFATFTNFLWIMSFLRPRDDRMIVASGACMLMYRPAYERVGGHDCCAGGLLEDHAFARAWRRAGERSLTLDGQDVVSVRMYRNLEEIVRGFQKNAAKVFRGPGIFWTFITLQVMVFLLPWVLAPASLLTVPPSHCWPVLVAVGNIILLRTCLAQAYRVPAWIALLHPVSLVAMLYVVLLSWYSITMGKGVTWKGRTYFTTPQVSTARRMARAPRLGA